MYCIVFENTRPKLRNQGAIKQDVRSGMEDRVEG